LARDVAKAVGAGVPWHLETVDSSDPNRPKTCLEVDFPILPINHIAAIEGNAGKPIYQMSKWWARRRSSVFRSMLIAAATKSPDDPAEAAKLLCDAYYGNHHKNEAYRKLKVADIFMGGGTTIVEGTRLGMQMYGNDLNPVAWFVVKNELAQVDPKEVQRFLDRIEAEVNHRSCRSTPATAPETTRVSGRTRRRARSWDQISTSGPARTYGSIWQTFTACARPRFRVDHLPCSFHGRCMGDER
jgi:hypothetical protein